MSHGRFDNPVIASLHGFYDRFRKQDFESRFTENDRADGKICLITGVNSGLGYAVAVEMARRGAHVIGTVRRLKRESESRIRKESGSEKVEIRDLDLSKIDSIHEFCDGLKRDNIKLDIVILNAGIALPRSRKTESGQDEMFLVNYLSNVIMTNLLLTNQTIQSPPPDLLPTGGRSRIPRIIFISSDSHQGSSYIDYEEFGKYIEYGVSKGIANYSYFKLILNTYATELSRRLNPGSVKVGVNVICPGPVHSNIIKPAPQPLRFVLGTIFKVIFRSPAKAAKPVVYLAISNDFEGKTNEYLHMFNAKKMDSKVYEPEEGSKLWERSMEVWREIDKLAVSC